MKDALFFLCLLLPMGHAALAETLPLEKAHTAVLITDPQNDFLREDGRLYGLLADRARWTTSRN